MLLCSLSVFLKSTFLKIILGIPPDCQTVLNKIRPNVLFGLIRVHTVCKIIAMPWGCLRFVIVVFPDHTHLLFLSVDDTSR